MASKKIVNEISGTIFSLPWLVARDEGLFERAGLDIEFVKARPLEGYEFVADHRDVPSIGPHRPFEEGQAAVYRACEWGQVRRAHDSERGGRIIGKRSAIGVQAILAAPGSRFTHPQTLRNQVIGVGYHTGTHYATLQMLEGYLAREEIKVVNVSPHEGYEAVRDGRLAAVTLMDPWLSLAEKNDFQKIIEAHYTGSEIASPEVDAQTWQEITVVLKEAVKRINADKRKYLHYLIDALPDGYRQQLTPDDFHLPRLRYIDPSPYDREEFQSTYDWLVGWDLIPPNLGFEQLVDNRTTVAA